MKALPSMPTGWLKLKCRLPSPMCPNEQARMPGSTRSAAAVPSAIICGIAAIGTEMSCLIDAPSLLCTSLICSRAASLRQRHARVADDAVLQRIFQRRLQRSRRAAFRSADFDQCVPRRHAGGWIAREQSVLELQVDAEAWHQLEGRQPRPRALAHQRE